MNIREYLKQYRLFTDGAMGTYYAALNENTDIMPEYGNLKNPDLIKTIHLEYLRAGAGLIRTNTFMANTQSLSLDKKEVSKIATAAVSIAKEAVAEYKEEIRDEGNNPIYIAGSIGPIPDNALSEEEELIEEYYMLADIMLNEGVDAVLFETFSDVDYIIKTADYIRAKDSNIFIMAQVTLNAGGYSGSGISGKRLLSYLAGSDSIDACGFNCGIGSGHMLKILKSLTLPENKYIIISPNSAYPEKLKSRMSFMDNKTYFAKNMNEIAEQSVDIIGACCGTSPNYIREVKKYISNEKADNGTDKSADRRKDISEISIKSEDENKLINKIEYVRKENIENIRTDKISDKINVKIKDKENRSSTYSILNMLKQGIKVTAVELDPPYNADDRKILEAAKTLKNCGVDIITIADSPMGRSRIDSILMASKMIHDISIPVMPHICCRDKNMIAMRSSLLGAYIHGIRNLLIVTGDPVPEGLKGNTKAVFDYNSIQLMKYVKEMNEEHFQNDPLTYGGAINYRVKNADIAAKRMLKKMEAGAEYFLTQPVYTDEDVDSVRYLKEITGAKILCGIMPFVSYKNAVFIKNEMTGIHLSDEILSRYHEEMSREEGEEAGAELAIEIINKLGEIADGYYFMLPFNRVSLMQKIQIKSLKKRQNGA